MVQAAEKENIYLIPIPEKGTDTNWEQIHEISVTYMELPT